MMSLSELEDESKFKKQLGEYWASKGITQVKIPQIGGQELNMFKLYRTVCKKGGGQSVSHNKLWKQIVDEFGLPSTCTSASFTLKNHYQKYLLGYEQRYFFGKDDSAGLPELVAGRQRRRHEGEYSLLHNRLHLTRPEHEQIQSTLTNELKKYYDKCDMKQHIHYIKRSKLYPSPPQVKHMLMAFQIEEPAIFAINTLTLLSLNTEAPFLFSQHMEVLDVIQHYLIRHFPCQSILDLECLRSLVLALRNLLLNHKNHQPLLHSDLFSTLLAIFYLRVDREVTRHFTDCLASLAHAVPQALLQALPIFLQKDAHEDQETALDLIRALLEVHHPVPFQELSRFILFSSLEIRETTLEILSLWAEQSEQARGDIVSSVRLMERICAGLTSNERQAGLAANVIKNLAKSHLGALKRYEQYIVAAAFNSELGCLAETLQRM